MEATEIELLQAKVRAYEYALTKAYAIDETELNKLIVKDGQILDTAADNLLQRDAARIARFKTEKQDGFKNGYAKAKEEERKAAVQALAEVTGLEIDTTDLNEAAQLIKQKLDEKPKKGAITDEDIKQHPLYVKLEKERIPKTEYEKLHSEHEQFKQSIEDEKIFGKVREIAVIGRQKLMADTEIYKDTPEVAANIERAYLNSFREYQFKSDGNGGLIVTKNGERVNDAHGNPLSVDDLVKKNVPQFYRLLKQPPKSGAGNENGDPGAGQQGQGDTVQFKTKSEYAKYVESIKGNDEASMKKRAEAFNLYKKGIETGAITE